MIMCPVLGCGVRSADRKAARQHARLHADVQHGLDYLKQYSDAVDRPYERGSTIQKKTG